MPWDDKSKEPVFIRKAPHRRKRVWEVYLITKL